MRRFFIAGVLMAGAVVAHGQILEDFENGNWGGYSQIDPSGYGVRPGYHTTQAAHTGQLGIEFFLPAQYPFCFMYGPHIQTSAGLSYIGWFRGSVDIGYGLFQEVKMGVAATLDGCYLLRAHGNSLQLSRVYDGYTQVEVLASSSGIEYGWEWNALQIDWASNGDMTARVFNDDRTVQLGATGTVSTGQTGSGGFAIFGASSHSSGLMGHFDSFSAVPEPATLLALGAGIAALASRRRRA